LSALDAPHAPFDARCLCAAAGVQLYDTLVVGPPGARTSVRLATVRSALRPTRA
jgi:hypothetical protein